MGVIRCSSHPGPAVSEPPDRLRRLRWLWGCGRSGPLCSGNVRAQPLRSMEPVMTMRGRRSRSSEPIVSRGVPMGPAERRLPGGAVGRPSVRRPCARTASEVGRSVLIFAGKGAKGREAAMRHRWRVFVRLRTIHAGQPRLRRLTGHSGMTASIEARSVRFVATDAGPSFAPFPGSALQGTDAGLRPQ